MLYLPGNLKSQWQRWARLHRKAIFSHLAVTNIRIVPTIGEQDVSQLRSLVKYQQRQPQCKFNRFYIIVHVRWTDTIVRASVVQNRNVLDSDWCFKKWCLPVTVRRENRRRHGHIAIRTVIDAKYYNISLRCFVQVLQIYIYIVTLMEWLTDRLIQVDRSIQVWHTLELFKKIT